MKNILKYLFFILLLAGFGGYIYWQKQKNIFIKNSVENAINKKTDNLYYIHYDSSTIDEVNGNAGFYNVSLQSDSVQSELLKKTDELPNVVFNIKVSEVKATGIDVQGFLQNKKVSAKKIFLNKPFIHIINTGTNQLKLYTAKDTLELYQKILGRFKSIHADNIQISNGYILITDLAGKSLITLENINITLNNFLVDRTRNYENIISYFINDVKVTVENIQLPLSKNNNRINIVNLDYDAVEKTLHIGNIQQYKINNSQPIIDLKNILLTGLSTDSFILNQHYIAAGISCDGGLITIYKREKISQNNKKPSMLLTSELLDQVKVGAVKMGNTKVVVVNTLKPKAEPFILNDVKFEVSKVFKASDGNTVSDLINDAEWKLSSSGFSFLTTDKLYKLTATSIDVDNIKSLVNIKKFTLIPQLSEDEFMRRRHVQGDRYDFTFNDIQLHELNFKKIINENQIEIEKVSLQPMLKIYNDRNLPFDTRSKVGKYPNQSLLKLNIPIYIKQLKINNGYIAYKEKSRQTNSSANVFFSNLNADIDNVTNIKERISNNPNCRIIATALFLGTGKLSTEWILPLNMADSTFTATGHLKQMDAALLNQITETLGMVTIKKGTINDLKFNLTGADYSTKRALVFLYTNLKVGILKKDKDDELKTKELTSIIANILIKNSNPKNGITRTGEIKFERDITKSFFNLLWKSVFAGVKKTASGKK